MNTVYMNETSKKEIDLIMSKIKADNDANRAFIQRRFDDGIVKTNICKSIIHVADLFKDIIKWAWANKYPEHFLICYVMDRNIYHALDTTGYTNWMSILVNGSCLEYLEKTANLGDYRMYSNENKITRDELYELRYEFLQKEWEKATSMSLGYDPLSRSVQCFVMDKNIS